MVARLRPDFMMSTSMMSSFNRAISYSLGKINTRANLYIMCSSSISTVRSMVSKSKESHPRRPIKRARFTKPGCTQDITIAAGLTVGCTMYSFQSQRMTKTIFSRHPLIPPKSGILAQFRFSVSRLVVWPARTWTPPSGGVSGNFVPSNA